MNKGGLNTDFVVLISKIVFIFLHKIFKGKLNTVSFILNIDDSFTKLKYKILAKKNIFVHFYFLKYKNTLIMKRISIILIAIMAITLSSCSKEEEMAQKLEGTWLLYSTLPTGIGSSPSDTPILNTDENNYLTFSEITKNEGKMQFGNNTIQNLTFEITSETTMDITIDETVTLKMDITLTDTDFTMNGGTSPALLHYKKRN